MSFSYKKLWKVLIDKNLTKTELRDMASISNSSLARLSKDENVTMNVLDRICKVLECRIEDIVEFIPDKEV